MRANDLPSVDPPGVFIKLELDARGWSQRDLAFVLGQTEQQLSPLLSGKRSISPDMARALGAAFGQEPEFFTSLQAQYDLRRAREPDPGVGARAALQGKYPVREMIRRGWIQEGDSSLLDLQVRRFFEADNDNLQAKRVGFAAKRTHTIEPPATQLAWIFRVRQLANLQEAPNFDKDRLTAALPRLRSLMIHPKAIEEVPGLLRSCGVRFVVVEVLPGSKIDGVCTWLDDARPVIGMSNLHDRIDNFWFVLRHEIEHVLQGHGKDRIAIVDQLTSSSGLEESQIAEEEDQANSAAADFCLAQDKLNSFYLRKKPYFYEKEVIGFASLNGVHPGIAVGQLQKRMGRWDFLRKYQVPIRKHLVDSAVCDGWGAVVETSL